MTHGGRVATTSETGVFGGLDDLPGIAVCAKVTSFISGSMIGMALPSRIVRLRKGGVFVGANSADVVPTVSKLGSDGQMCADASLVRLSMLPHRLVVINNNCVNLRFTSVCTDFNDGIAMLRKNGGFVTHRSHSVTSTIGRALRGGKVRVHLGTHTRSVRSATSNIALACASATSKGPIAVRNSTVLMTAKHGPVARNLGLRTTKIRMSDRKTVIMGNCLRAATPGV